MYIDTLRLTDVGLQATKNADQSGIYIKPVRVVAGSYTGPAPLETPKALLGSEIWSGPLAYIEVLSKNSVRFSFRIPQNVPAGQTGLHTTIGEFLILLEDGRVFGHVLLKDPQLKVNTFGLQFSLIVADVPNIGAVVDVQMSEHSTVPCVADVELLPAPVSSDFNCIAVFNLKANSDGTFSPALATRYGAGGMEWGFSEHDRLFSSALTGRWLTENQFRVDDYYKDLKAGDTVIVQVISGPALGAVRHFKVNSDKTLTNSGTAIPHLDPSCYISVWRRSVMPTNSQTSLTWPSNSDVPNDWVLSRGDDGDLIWMPPSGGSSTTVNGATLYDPPSMLVMKAITTTAVVSDLDYVLPVVPASASDVMVALSTINQHRTSFEVTHSGIRLSEAVPMDLLMDVRVAEHVPSQGNKIEMSYFSFVGDGVTNRFKVDSRLPDAAHAIVITQHLRQPVTSYTVEEGYIVFTEPLPIGTEAGAYCFVPVDAIGYSTRLRHVNIRTLSPTSEFELPLTPLETSYVLFSESGAMITPDNFNVVGNLLTTTSKISAMRDIEITIVENVQSLGLPDNSLQGVVTYAQPSPNGMRLFRHGMPDLEVPMPVPDVKVGAGLRVEGRWPSLKFINSMAEKAAKDPVAGFCLDKRESDTEEIIVTKRIQFNGNILISASGNFAAKLGPGFSSNGQEEMQYMVVATPAGSAMPKYGQGISGTDEAGFSVVSENTDATAYSNASINRTFEITAANHPAKYVDVTAKMRVSGALVKSYGSKLSCCLNITVMPL